MGGGAVVFVTLLPALYCCLSCHKGLREIISNHCHGHFPLLQRSPAEIKSVILLAEI